MILGFFMLFFDKVLSVLFSLFSVILLRVLP